MTHQESITRLETAINSHSATNIAACFSAEYISENPHRPSNNFHGNTTVLRNWTAILARFPDLTARVLRFAINGDEVWSEWEMEGVAADGTTVGFVGPVIWGIDALGLVSWARFYLDPVDD